MTPHANAPKDGFDPPVQGSDRLRSSRRRSGGRRAKRRVGGALLAVLVIGLAGCEPQDRRPGLWLSGEEVEGPVEDWSFSDEHPEIFVETRTWYGIPHSVTTVCAVHDGTLYVPSLFREGSYPDGKYWTSNVARDPRVRVKIGDRLYERKAVLVTDAEEREKVLAAFARKYPFWRQLRATPAADRPELVFFRMEPRDTA